MPETSPYIEFTKSQAVVFYCKCYGIFTVIKALHSFDNGRLHFTSFG